MIFSTLIPVFVLSTAFAAPLPTTGPNDVQNAVAPYDNTIGPGQDPIDWHTFVDELEEAEGPSPDWKPEHLNDRPVQPTLPMSISRRQTDDAEDGGRVFNLHGVKPHTHISDDLKEQWAEDAKSNDDENTDAPKSDTDAQSDNGRIFNLPGIKPHTHIPDNLKDQGSGEGNANEPTDATSASQEDATIESEKDRVFNLHGIKPHTHIPDWLKNGSPKEANDSSKANQVPRSLEEDTGSARMRHYWDRPTLDTGRPSERK